MQNKKEQKLSGLHTDKYCPYNSTKTNPMKKPFLLLLLFCFIITVQAQKKEFKCKDIYEAAKLIDAGKYDESIAMLKECEKADPTEHAYPYEIALAYTYKEEYQKAIDQLEKIKNYKDLGPDYYQLLGNAYDYAKNPKKAISVYDEKNLAILVDGQEKYSHTVRILKNKEPETFESLYTNELQMVKDGRKAVKESETEEAKQSNFLLYKEALISALDNTIQATLNSL